MTLSGSLSGPRYEGLCSRALRERFGRSALEARWCRVAGVSDKSENSVTSLPEYSCIAGRFRPTDSERDTPKELGERSWSASPISDSSLAVTAAT